MSAIERRLERLERRHGPPDRRLFMIDLPDGYETDQALADLGVGSTEGDIVIVWGRPDPGSPSQVGAQP